MYVDAPVADALADKLLDVHVEEDSIRFALLQAE